LETFSLACAEAMAHGIPVLASRIGGLPEVVNDSENGLLFEPGNALELAQRMDQLWHDPQMITRLGVEARRKAVAEYHPETYYQRLLTLYQAATRGAV
jgi:glycosyltransferase involved in cell wall biosynthesis